MYQANPSSEIESFTYKIEFSVKEALVNCTLLAIGEGSCWLVARLFDNAVSNNGFSMQMLFTLSYLRQR